MRARLMAPALMMLAGCYFTPTDEQVEGDSEGLSTEYESGGTDPLYGNIGEDRGKFEEGPFTVYWRWYDTWDQGTCMEVTLRNGDTAVSWWDLTMELDQDLTQWTYEDGAFFWPEGDKIFVEPTSSGSISRRSSKELYYCAEPLHQIVGATVNYETPGSSSGDGGEGSSGDGGEGSSGDGDDGGDGGDVELRATRGELFPTPFTVRWYQSAEWEQGNCTHVTLINGAEVVDDWELTLHGDTDFTLTSEWGAWLVPSGDSMRVSPNDTDGLRAGETISFGYCTEPHTAITDASADVTFSPTEATRD